LIWETNSLRCGFLSVKHMNINYKTALTDTEIHNLITCQFKYKRKTPEDGNCMDLVLSKGNINMHENDKVRK